MNPLSGPSIFISGVGAYAPNRILTNGDLSGMVETSDSWIQTRTGIRERRIAGDTESTSHMATEAARRALAASGLEPAAIDLVLVATATGDMAFPSTACAVQQNLGLRRIPCFDLGAACSGFIYVLEVARSLMLTGNYRNALIIGSEKLSRIVNWNDRSTCVLFGDGAGAAVLSRTEQGGVGILKSLLGADGTAGEILSVPGPNGHVDPDFVPNTIRMQGKEVFKLAVRVMCQSATDILEQAGCKASDVALVIPHQANIRIIEALDERLGLGLDRYVVNLDRFGNTSAASIPLALDEAVTQGRLRSGDLVLLVAFGAGLTWGASLLQWHHPQS